MVMVLSCYYVHGSSFFCGLDLLCSCLAFFSRFSLLAVSLLSVVGSTAAAVSTVTGPFLVLLLHYTAAVVRDCDICRYGISISSNALFL